MGRSGQYRGMWVCRGRDDDASQAIVTVSDVTLRTDILINTNYDYDPPVVFWL